MKKLNLLCPHCHSTNIVRDAVARWSPDTNEWELSCVQDNMTCEDCEREFYCAEEMPI